MIDLTTTERRKARVRTLVRMIENSAVLIDRFGEGATLGEMKSGIIAHLAFLQGRPMTISNLANESGQARESISRWIERSPYVQLKEHPDDARSKLMEPVDLETMMAYLDLIIDLEMEKLRAVVEKGLLDGYVEQLEVR